MAKDPAFLFYPGDYLRDTQNLGEAAQVAYDRIMCEHMRNICISQKQLNFFTKRMNDDEKAELMFVVEECEGGFHIPWVSESINKRRAYSESRRNNRKGKTHKKISKTYVKHMENEIENEDVNKSEIEIRPTFEEFWKAYDHGREKKQAVAQWKKVKQQDREEIMRVVPEYVASTPDKKFRKTAWRWLRDERWKDEIIPLGNLDKKSDKKRIVEDFERFVVERHGTH